MNAEVNASLYADLLKALIPVVSVVIGGAIGGGVSYFISKSNFKRERQSRDLDDYKKSIYEIAISFSEYEDASNRLIAYHIDVANRSNENPFTFEEVHAEYASALAKYRKSKASIKILKLEEADKILSQCIKHSNNVFVGFKRLKGSQMQWEMNEFRENADKFYSILPSYIERAKIDL